MTKKSLTSLLRKREALEAEIASAQVIEKRKSEVINMQELINILPLPDHILRLAFSRIAAENKPKQ